MFSFSNTLVRLAMRLSEISPAFKTFLWRRWYQHLAGYQVNGWQFMNYGYAPLESDAVALKLEVADEPNRFAIQLYNHIVSPIPLAGMKVLEVGCGRGGGASFVMRYHRPLEMTGVDFSSKAIRFCESEHKTPGLKFLRGNAEALPFADAAFDAVVNVESSHCYRSVPNFLAQVNRVLRPGGHLLLADLRVAGDHQILHEQLQASGLKILEQEDITANVLRALQADSVRKMELIDGAVSKQLRHMFREFAAIEGSEIFNAFNSRGALYIRYLLQKDAAIGGV